MVERSNVNAVNEMTDMIEVMRKYQSVARMLQSDHYLQRNMIQQFSRV
jgi:flagellar basal-body rod protein FlgF